MDLGSGIDGFQARTKPIAILGGGLKVVSRSTFSRAVGHGGGGATLMASAPQALLIEKVCTRLPISRRDSIGVQTFPNSVA